MQLEKEELIQVEEVKDKIVSLPEINEDTTSKTVKEVSEQGEKHDI